VCSSLSEHSQKWREVLDLALARGQSFLRRDQVVMQRYDQCLQSSGMEQIQNGQYCARDSPSPARTGFLDELGLH